jgi:hypothetical protein
MRALEALANRIKAITVLEVLKHLSENKQFTDLIIELNTRKQLFDKGIDSTGRQLSDVGGNYSPYTLQLHPEKIEDKITLFDTGDFYESFRVFYSNGDFIISADTIKDTSNLIEDWGANILGLTNESLSLLREKAKEIIIPYVRKKILTR